MTIAQPPLYQPLADQTGKTAMQWALFFSLLATGDQGAEWIPNFSSLTSSSGTPTLDGWTYQLNSSLVLFRATVTPASGANTSATAGTTAITNFPFSMKQDGIVFAVGNKTGTGSGMCEQSSGKIWVPAWTTVSSKVTLLGIVEAS